MSGGCPLSDAQPASCGPNNCSLAAITASSVVVGASRDADALRSFSERLFPNRRPKIPIACSLAHRSSASSRRCFSAGPPKQERNPHHHCGNLLLFDDPPVAGGAWYVAIHPAELEPVASCGVVVTAGRGRVQTVDTVTAYRRRGICSRLRRLPSAARDQHQLEPDNRVNPRRVPEVSARRQFSAGWACEVGPSSGWGRWGRWG